MYTQDDRVDDFDSCIFFSCFVVDDMMFIIPNACGDPFMNRRSLPRTIISPISPNLDRIFSTSIMAKPETSDLTSLKAPEHCLADVCMIPVCRPGRCRKPRLTKSRSALHQHRSRMKSQMYSV